MLSKIVWQGVLSMAGQSQQFQEPDAFLNHKVRPFTLERAMTPTAATTTTTTNATTTTTTTAVSRPITTTTAHNPSPTMKLKDLGVVPVNIYEMPNPLVRMGENAIASLGKLIFTTLDDRWLALHYILTNVSEISYSPSGNEFLGGLGTVVAKNKHRFPALRALKDKVESLIEEKGTATHAQVLLLNLFNLLIALESPSTEDPHVALIRNFDSAGKICRQLDAMLTREESASAPNWKQAEDE